jgi:hypothetical protein
MENFYFKLVKNILNKYFKFNFFPSSLLPVPWPIVPFICLTSMAVAVSFPECVIQSVVGAAPHQYSNHLHPHLVAWLR